MPPNGHEGVGSGMPNLEGELLKGATLRPAGEAAIVVEFGDTIDWSIQSRVLAFCEALEGTDPEGVVEIVPTYRSALIDFDPEVTDVETILASLHGDGTHDAAGTGPGRRTWDVPIRLDDEAAEDRGEVAEALGLDRAEIERLLLSSPLRVGMYGFAPGFAYLRGLDPALDIPRRKTPRPPMPEGAVIIANGQAAIAPRSMPTGWYVVGRTPIRMFDPDREGAAMVPFAIGERIRLRAVDRDEYERMMGEPERGLRRATGD